MFKYIKFILVVVPFVIVVAAIILYSQLNTIVKHGVEALGPEVTRSEIRLKKSDISVFSGEGALLDLVVGNPRGFKSESAFELSEVRIKVDVRSFFSDTIVIESIYMEAPEITYEITGKNTNINSIINNIRAYAGAAGEDAQDGASKGGKKILIKDLQIISGKVNLSAMGGKQITLSLPDIHLVDIGTGEGGISASQALAEVMVEVNKGIAIAVGGQTGGAIQKATEKIKGLFSR